MSWLRDMKRRLTQLEEGNKLLHDLFDKTTIKNTEENKPKNFQFPIISDHEIYGWEPKQEKNEWHNEELVNERQDDHENEELQNIEDDYEIVPLSQNERWPGRYEKAATIYRADSIQESSLPVPSLSERRIRPQREVRAQREIQPKREFRPIQELQARREQFPREEVEVEEEPVKQRPKKMRRPFSPSHVPSPVYGYKKTSSVGSAIEDIQLKKEQAQSVDIESSKESRDEENHVIETTPLFASSTEKCESTNDTGRVYDVSPETFHSNEVLQESTIIEDTEELSQTEQVVFDHAVGVKLKEDFFEEVEEAFSTSEKKCQEVELPNVETIEESSSITLNPTENFTEEPSETEVVTVAETAYMTTEQLEQKKKEKIVPFNVMMLSSDKEKLAMKSKEQHKEEGSIKLAESKQAIIQEKPLVAEPNSVQMSIEEEVQEELEEEPPPHYGFPLMGYLAPPEEEVIDEEWLEMQSAKLEETLSHFAVHATVEHAMQGPAVTMFELTVEQGVKVSKIRNLTDDLKLALAARDIRIQAPIPGTSRIGIEIPNRQTRAVRISEVINSPAFKKSESPLEAVLGLSLTGEPQTIDLRKMPHGMIAGATGSGKSVCINSLLISLLYKASYHDLKLLLIDPKMVELAPYNGIPHLLSPVITDVKAATAALKWAVQEMERRYELFAHSSVRNIERYNEMVMNSRRFSLKMPYILVVIDELADLMMMAPADVEVSISRITQKARACGIHLIIATQRPSVDVITGTIKANIPTRIAFAVSSQVDSRTILDSVGADRLLGKGDMLYLGNGQSAPVRLQGTFVTDDEIERIIEHVRNEADPDYLFGQDDLLAAAVEEEETDPLFQQACSFIIEQGSASTSALQRQFSIGYNRAAKLIDRMEANQFISEQRGSRPRDVFLTEQTFESFMK
ncbi:DNA translocase FtsK [Sporosarcina sp. PTS2304]|uniref:DNA translocase FtsK n=1 Tax=Sporosarcina sp. PTS2304 TaxID=2283194 RepID=UPI001F087A53|nr:DNA translocase FtsK [Sporosarcina sp. PTS2304]